MGRGRVLVATLFLIVPGILLATAWFYVYFFVADLDLTIGGAMKASWRTVQRGGLGPHLLLNIIVLALTVVPAVIPYLGFFLGLAPRSRRLFLFTAAALVIDGVLQAPAHSNHSILKNFLMSRSPVTG